MTGMTGIINLIEKPTVFIKQKSIILTGTTSILNLGDITVIDIFTKRSITIMKTTIAVGIHKRI
jgi:hypothetical protein